MAKKTLKNRPKQPTSSNTTISRDTTPTETATAAIDVNTDLPTITTQTNTSTPAETRQTFSKFIAVAPITNIAHFLKLAATKPDSENLIELWERAFNEGYESGRISLLESLEEEMKERVDEGIEKRKGCRPCGGIQVAKEEFDKVNRDDEGR
jgi:hypothetical protein